MHEDARSISSHDSAKTEADPQEPADNSSRDRYWLREGGKATKRAAALTELEGKQDELAVQKKMRGMKMAFWGTIGLVLAGVVFTLVT